jgi:hypothetical protein
VEHDGLCRELCMEGVRRLQVYNAAVRALVPSRSAAFANFVVPVDDARASAAPPSGRAGVAAAAIARVDGAAGGGGVAFLGAQCEAAVKAQAEAQGNVAQALCAEGGADLRLEACVDVDLAVICASLPGIKAAAVARLVACAAATPLSPAAVIELEAAAAAIAPHNVLSLALAQDTAPAVAAVISCAKSGASVHDARVVVFATDGGVQSAIGSDTAAWPSARFLIWTALRW